MMEREALAERSAFGVTTHDFVEAPQQRFTFRVRSRLIDARLDAGLRLLGDPPVFTIRLIPEFNRVVGAKVGPRELGRMEMPLADDLGAVVRVRPERIRQQ